ncbi:hypothetical protein CQW23_21337 [Capsicum baccatum]|uniref:Uncharacterized protein n=1 Tax=Capsicum baccatum TaxID=33114 RepID=A0A2G2VXQ1_CAPBA|nr:hypothetical protein CQW23_21337 [Capsicum baccatum]
MLRMASSTVELLDGERLVDFIWALNIKRTKIRVEVLDGVHSNYRDIYEDPKSSSSKFIEYYVPAKLSNEQIDQYCACLSENSTWLCSSLKNDSPRCIDNILKCTRKCCDHPYLEDKSLEGIVTKDIPQDQRFDVEIKLSGKLELLNKILQEIKQQRQRALILFQSYDGSGVYSIRNILGDLIRKKFGGDSCLISGNHENNNHNGFSKIVKVQENGGTYSSEIPLHGEVEMQRTDSSFMRGLPENYSPHDIWKNLLHEVDPKWKHYFPSSSRGNIRKVRLGEQVCGKEVNRVHLTPEPNLRKKCKLHVQGTSHPSADNKHKTRTRNTQEDQCLDDASPDMSSLPQSPYPNQLQTRRFGAVNNAGMRIRNTQEDQCLHDTSPNTPSLPQSPYSNQLQMEMEKMQKESVMTRNGALAMMSISNHEGPNALLTCNHIHYPDMKKILRKYIMKQNHGH